ncbi:Trypsin-1 [Orchesella cincta]|uniref:Trypsin-1 n=1 Tax=Orchesella cincta TaxID=48709 RepID=A0A1D2M2T9_ORCCI|nr:Trypsin-1 [Orchesella cincta]
MGGPRWSHRSHPNFMGGPRHSHFYWPTGRIVGGTNAQLSETPYQLRLIIRKPGSVTNCGAVLVASFNIQFALTAAHCVNGATASPSKMEVIAGLHNLKRKTGSEQTKNPIRVVKHSRYTSGNSANDIAILFFATRFNPTSAVHQVKISGWGSTSIGRPNSQSIYPDILQVLTISTLDNAECQRRFGHLGTITSKQICLLQPGVMVGSCTGDSGGPAAGIDSNGRMYVAGLSSYHLGGCGGGRFPMFYTRVSAYISWIQRRVNEFKNSQRIQMEDRYS